jgi:hypothetical protein
MLKALILDLQRKGPSASEGLVAACGAFIAANGRLLPTFMKVLWIRTNVYRTEDVYQSFSFLDYWMTVNVEYHQVLPDNFEHKFLSLGIQRVVECDLVICKAQALWFLYRQLDRFQQSPRDALLKTVILDPQTSISLVLHWNALVRKIFIFLLIFQILPLADKPISGSVYSLISACLGSEAVCKLAELTAHPQDGNEPGVFLAVEPRLLKYQSAAVTCLEETIKAYRNWKESGSKARPNLHVPLFFGLERDAEPSTMHR